MTHHTPAIRRSILRFKAVGEVISELKKVVWLTRREAMYLTFLVLMVSIVAGLLLGSLDYGFTRLIDKLLLGK